MRNARTITAISWQVMTSCGRSWEGVGHDGCFRPVAVPKGNVIRNYF